MKLRILKKSDIVVDSVKFALDKKNQLWDFKYLSRRSALQYKFKSVVNLHRSYARIVSESKIEIASAGAVVTIEGQERVVPFNGVLLQVDKYTILVSTWVEHDWQVRHVDKGDVIEDVYIDYANSDTIVFSGTCDGRVISHCVMDINRVNFINRKIFILGKPNEHRSKEDSNQLQ